MTSETSVSSADMLDRFRRQAKQLGKAFALGDSHAQLRVSMHPPGPAGKLLRHADFLHVVAQEQSFPTWPSLKLAVETEGMDRAAKVQRLKLALAHGQVHVVKHLMWDSPDLARGQFGLQVALYDLAAVEHALKREPALAVKHAGPRSPMAHLCFSPALQIWPEREGEMLQIAALLKAHGADVNDSIAQPGTDHRLSVLYGASGHAGNLPLTGWLLEAGADPNDGESLYHCTEPGRGEALRLILKHGANPTGTNALLRAMDFNDHTAVRLLLEHGADPNEFNDDEVGGETPWVIPALHQIARRDCDGEMAQILVDAGADLTRRWQGVTPYAMARVYGNVAVAEVFARAGAEVALTPLEQALADAKTESDTGKILPEVPEIYKHLLHELIPLDRVTVPWMKSLISAGIDTDMPGGMGLTPAMIAAWEGQVDVLEYFLSLGVNLKHVNAYGGGYLGTCIHGAENCPNRDRRDHLRCLELLLQAGVPLPKRAADLCGVPELSEFMRAYGEEHPEQLVEGAA
ncbi:ankyrin repeat domain-containing protein [Halocynthiibacter styelae]|uniref:Ankyrin repeat domain-containing protein n=1 Tax=Halocynthiibacter styelae TaxID=2761955 RepID=A0A8J7LVW4_9RHOB|nr:ankyrin repeat domain-containing protein [Paenihalocynthiibacter styelae]MBI1493582.1 ankyrin repeat domain-containing protein [Paenihalocynthiibacter styelae]